jgi:hypothetical protein
MSEDPIRRAFDLLDQQAVPSPEFAEDLFDRLLSEAKLRPAPPRPRRPRRPSVRPELRRAFTITTALGIALIGTAAYFVLVRLIGVPPVEVRAGDGERRPPPSGEGLRPSVYIEDPRRLTCAGGAQLTRSA